MGNRGAPTARHLRDLARRLWRRATPQFPDPPRSDHPPPVRIAVVAELLGASPLSQVPRPSPDRPRSLPYMPTGIALVAGGDVGTAALAGRAQDLGSASGDAW